MQTPAYMCPQHPRWDEFADKLGGKDGCDFTDDGKWKCGGGKDKTFSTTILHSMGFDDGFIARSMSYFELHGGFCDCEILFNIDATHREKMA